MWQHWTISLKCKLFPFPFNCFTFLTSPQPSAQDLQIWRYLFIYRQSAFFLPGYSFSSVNVPTPSILSDCLYFEASLSSSLFQYVQGKPTGIHNTEKSAYMCHWNRVSLILKGNWRRSSSHLDEYSALCSTFPHWDGLFHPLQSSAHQIYYYSL